MLMLSPSQSPGCPKTINFGRPCMKVDFAQPSNLMWSGWGIPTRRSIELPQRAVWPTSMAVGAQFRTTGNRSGDPIGDACPFSPRQRRWCASGHRRCIAR
jgi:hypothetical protein